MTVTKTKIELVDRALFCPIGRLGSLKLLPATFTRLCLHYQEAVKVERKQPLGVPSLNNDACGICPVRKFIKEGVNPVLVVKDMLWFSDDDVTTIQQTLQVTMHKLTSIANSKNIDEFVMKQIKIKILKIKESLELIMKSVDELSLEIERLSPSSTVKKEKKPFRAFNPPINTGSRSPILEKVIEQASLVLKEEELPNEKPIPILETKSEFVPLSVTISSKDKTASDGISYAVAKRFYNMKEPTFVLYKRMYDSYIKGISLLKIASDEGLSRKHVGECISKFKKIITRVSLEEKHNSDMVK